MWVLPMKVSSNLSTSLSPISLADGATQPSIVQRQRRAVSTEDPYSMSLNLDQLSTTRGVVGRP